LIYINILAKSQCNKNYTSAWYMQPPCQTLILNIKYSHALVQPVVSSFSCLLCVGCK